MIYKTREQSIFETVRKTNNTYSYLVTYDIRVTFRRHTYSSYVSPNCPNCCFFYKFSSGMLSMIGGYFSSLILRFRKNTVLPWSCNRIWPFGAKPKLTQLLYLLMATKFLYSFDPRLYSTTL